MLFVTTAGRRFKGLSKQLLFGTLISASLNAAQGWEVPEEERTKNNPVEASPAVLEEGSALYKKQCLMCHGEALKGDGPAVEMFQAKPPDLSTSEARSRLTDGEIFYKMTVGKNPMPSMKSRLSAQERWKVVHFLRSLQSE